MNDSRSLLRASKHPLVVLLAGTLLGSVLIPFVNSEIDRERRLRDLRAEHSRVVLKSSLDVERKLNLLNTAFESFYKDDVVSGQTTVDSRRALRVRVYELHEDFDRDAWWWHEQLLDEAKVVGLLDDARLSQLERAVRNYKNALLTSTELLDRYWAQLIRSQEPVSPAAAVKTVNEVKPLLRELGDKRRQAIREMVQALVS